ncbi:MAG TPA: DUF397 domain-containing protein [Pseudonocardiaceae bacterium]|jgi:hypothetical protein|nr:DUF397 domain-containing protein [Pseudonocardiaceae bacterium]
MVAVPQPVAPACWQKSSVSGASGCAEIGHVQDDVWVRHSKSPDGPVLTCSRARWAIFIAGICSDQFRSV